LVRRVINANVRVGKAENTRTLSRLAANEELPTAIRVEALDALADWAKPPGRDRVLGLWRPVEPRSGETAKEALRGEMAGLLADEESQVSRAAGRAAGTLLIRDAAPALRSLVEDPKRASAARIEGLKALSAQGDSHLADSVRRALADTDPRLRNEALRLLARL